MLTTNQTDNCLESLSSVHHRFSLKLPGITEESQKTTLDLLKKNHASHHCFFNDKEFHNHLPHHLLAAFSLGAQPKRLEEIYELHAKYQRPIIDITGQPEITEENWNQFLGQEEYYANYLRFWTREIKNKGVDGVLQTYLFDTSKEGTQDFFACFMGGVYHQVIHVGYGLEFSVEFVTVEGLAMAAVSKSDVKPILLEPPTTTGPIDSAIQAFASFTSQFGFPSPSAPPNPSPSALSIIDLVYSDRSLDNVVKFEDDPKFSEVLNKIPEKVKEYVEMWTIDSTSEDDVFNKTKELMGVAMSVYAGPTRPGKDPKLDFFLMHSLTSALFLPIFLSHLSLVHATRLIQAHFSVTIAYYIAQGRPRVYLVDNIFSYKSQSDYNDQNSNPWLKVIERAIAHDDEHLVKAIRSLIWGATHMDSFKEPRDTIGGYPYTQNYWLNSAKLTLDAIHGENWWSAIGIGFDEAWNGKEKKPDF